MGRNSNRSGRGSGRGRGAGRGGRGTGGQSRVKKTLAENIFYTGAVTQASDFVVVRKYLINFIKKTYDYGDDIGEALMKGEPPDMDKWLPKIKESQELEPEKAEAENARFEWLYREQMKIYMKREEIYEKNLKKAYSFLYGQCAKNMQETLESRDDYESEIYGDPFKLLEAIRQEALSFSKNKYEMSSVHATLKAYMNTRQKDGESLIDYSRRFKAARDVLISHLGGLIILTKYVMQMKGYDEENMGSNVLLIDEAFEEFVAYSFMDGADKSKYGKMLETLEGQYSFKNNQYPKNLEDAITAMKAHKFDDKYHEEKKKKKKTRQ